MLKNETTSVSERSAKNWLPAFTILEKSLGNRERRTLQFFTSDASVARLYPSAIFSFATCRLRTSLNLRRSFWARPGAFAACTTGSQRGSISGLFVCDAPSIVSKGVQCKRGIGRKKAPEQDRFRKTALLLWVFIVRVIEPELMDGNHQPEATFPDHALCKLRNQAENKDRADGDGRHIANEKPPEAEHRLA